MDGYTTTTIHMTPRQFKEYIPTPDDFDSVYTEERVRQIAEAFRCHLAAARFGADYKSKESTENSWSDSAIKFKPLEETVSTAWAEVGRKFSLFPGHVFHHCEVELENEDEVELENEEEEEVRPVVNAALLSESDSDCSMCDEPNWELQRLSMVFQPRGPAESDPFDKRDDDNCQTTIGCRHVSELLATCAEHIFAYQHRTHLFQVFVNRERFRVLRWDRSGIIVTDAVDYVNDLAGTRLLLQFLHGFCKLSDAAQGRDCTAVRVKPGSCGWMRMNVLAFSHGDVDHTERPGVTSDVFPANFAFPEKTLNAPMYPLFEHGMLHPDPCAACNPSADHHSSILYPDPLPVWKYIRDLFRESLGSDWPRYELTVCGRKYLVGKPMFEASGMVSRGTRGYIALEWSTQRFVFLKDAWRPFYVGVDREGDVLSELNEARVPYVPTLIAHEDVPGTEGEAQETETSRYAPHASTELRKNIQRTSDRARLDTAPRSIIAPLPSRKSTTLSQDSQEASLSSVHSSTPTSPRRWQDIVTPSGSIPRGVKRSAKDVQDEDVVAQEGLGLRHLTHYRVVVAEVCLPSTAFTSGKQWVRIVLHCIQGHQAAYEDCKLIHRDVSVGNILIYPKYYAGNETLDGIVFWEGRLCDWELATKIVPEVERQLERTGTWQFMSVRCLRDPTLPVLLPDELESFSYAMIYNAVRFLLHNMKHIHGFVKQYFDDSPLNANNRNSAPRGKEAMIKTGDLEFGDITILFQDDAENDNHPLNELINALLEKFRARYDVLAWQARVAKQKKREALRAARLLDKPFAPQHDTPRVNVDMIALSGRRSGLWSSRRTVTRLPTTTVKKAQSRDTEPIPRPPPADFEHAASLGTHHAIVGIFEAYLYSDEVDWPAPGHDVVGYDRLDGYRPPPPAVLCSGHPAKRAKTVLDDQVLRRAPTSAKTSSRGKGKGTARGRNCRPTTHA